MVMMMMSRYSVIWFFVFFFEAWVCTMDNVFVHGSTWFDSPSKYTQWRAGELMMIRLMSDTHAPIGGEIQLIDQNGFFPRDLGKVGFVNNTSPVAEISNTTNTNGYGMSTSTYSFKVWDQLPDGNRYQLAFFPFSAAHGSNAFSYYFTVIKHG
ncbi:hypothetical protein BCR42DRAFT_408848 [Absidia repens]|uniref:Uncharacterized protein n=1 Tax=Absidia repens TaxID=90262 RepID=A0A1X2IQ94_9FUNG|nr:hypothetical protein BCR42DRAFT_408848 [Absidia repens]